MDIIQIGSEVGPYRIERELGEGGMAQVFKAWHSELHRFEALKVPVARGAVASQGEQVFVARFLAEARTAARLSHPHIATVFGASPAGAPQPYFAMELVEGIDLAELLEQKGRLTPEEALAILEPVADALDYAHGQGVIHRDIKPANVLLRAQGEGWFPKVVDFGIARAADVEGGAGRTRLTQAGSVIGTPEYMSPEQADGKDDADHRSDIYSLGVVAYEMLCGRPPFVAENGASSISVLIQHLKDVPPSPSLHESGLSGPMDAALLWALAKPPGDRPNTCTAFVQAIRGAVPIREGGGPKRVPAAALVGLGALLLVSATGWYAMNRPRAAAVPAPDGPAPAAPAPSISVPAPAAPRIEQAADLAKQAATLVDGGAAATQDVETEWRNKTLPKQKALALLREQPPKFAEARKLATRAMQLDGKNSEARYQFCRSLYYLSDRRAEAEIEKAIRLSPDDGRLKLLRSVNQESMRDARKP